MTAQNQSTPRSSSESCNTIPRGIDRAHRACVVAVLFVTALLGACATGNADKDGVPLVDIRGTIVPNTDAQALAYYKNFGGRLPAKRMVTVEQKQISLSEFVQAYCKGNDMNQTCSRAKTIIMLDSTRGPRETLPVGV